MQLRDLHGVTMIEQEECLDLLSTRHVGRLAVVDGARPLIFPVNYALVGDHIVLRTNPGTKMRAALRSPVAFEVDDIDEERECGWSVVVTGGARLVTDYDEGPVRDLVQVPLRPFGGPKPGVIRIVAETITGRWVGQDDRPA